MTRIEFSSDNGATWQTASVSTEATEEDPCRGHEAFLSDDVYDSLECSEFGEEIEICGVLYRMTSE